MIYLVIFIILLAGVRFDKKKPTTASQIWWWLEFAVIVLMLGFRYKVGGDTLAYQYEYSMAPTLDYLFEHGFYVFRRQPLWLVLQAICKQISPDEFYLFQFVNAIIVNYVFFWFFKKYCKRPYLMVSFYFVMVCFLYNMEIMRQSIAISLFLLSIPYLLKKRYFIYSVFILIACGFHISAVVLFLVPFVFTPFTKRNAIITSLVIVIVFIFLAQVGIFKNLIQSINALMLTDTFGRYIDRQYNLNGVIGDLIFKFAIPFFFLMTHSNRDKFYNGFLSLYVIMVGMGTTFIFFMRITDFFVIPFYVILINECDTALFSKRFVMNTPNFALILLLTLTLFMRWEYYTRDYGFRTGYSDAKFYNIYIPYHSILDPEEEPVRNAIFWGEATPKDF